MKIMWLTCLLLAISTKITGCFHQTEKEPQFLSQEQVKDPGFIDSWLQSNRDIDQTDAKRFFQQGMQDKARSAWSPAAKSFGASMLLYPSPEALSEYIEAHLQMLAIVRRREGSIQEQLKSDMAGALPFYRSALAADTVLRTLPVQERARIQAHANCLEAYAASSQPRMDCQPLRWYYNAAQ